MSEVVEVPPRPLNVFFAFRTVAHYALAKPGATTNSPPRSDSVPSEEKQIDAPLFLSTHPHVGLKIRSLFARAERDLALKPASKAKPRYRKKGTQANFSKTCSGAWKLFRSDRRSREWEAFEELVRGAIEEHRRRWPDYKYMPGMRKGVAKARRARAVSLAVCLFVRLSMELTSMLGRPRLSRARLPLRHRRRRSPRLHRPHLSLRLKKSTLTLRPTPSTRDRSSTPTCTLHR